MNNKILQLSSRLNSLGLKKEAQEILILDLSNQSNNEAGSNHFCSKDIEDGCSNKNEVELEGEFDSLEELMQALFGIEGSDNYKEEEEEEEEEEE